MEVTDVLVTGGCGFIGSRVIQHLQEKHPEYQITVLDSNISHTKSGVDYVQADITRLTEVQTALQRTSKRYQVVIHCVGFSPPLNERYSRRMDVTVFAINVEGTRNMLRVSLDMGVKAFIYTSSICVVTDDFSQSYANIDERWPLVQRGKATSYGESKAEAETLVLQANSDTFKTCALRLAVVFGEGDYQFLPPIIDCIVLKNESPYRLGDGMNLWDTVYVGNAADAHVLAAENLLSENPTAAGEAFFIHNNEPISARDFMLQTWKTFNGHIPPFELGIPAQLGWIAGYLGELITRISGKPSTISRGSIGDATAMRYTNGGKASRILGYTPRVNLEKGLCLSCEVSLVQ